METATCLSSFREAVVERKGLLPLQLLPLQQQQLMVVVACAVFLLLRGLLLLQWRRLPCLLRCCCCLLPIHLVPQTVRGHAHTHKTTT